MDSIPRARTHGIIGHCFRTRELKHMSMDLRYLNHPKSPRWTLRSSPCLTSSEKQDIGTYPIPVGRSELGEGGPRERDNVDHVGF